MRGRELDPDEGGELERRVPLESVPERYDLCVEATVLDAEKTFRPILLAGVLYVVRVEDAARVVEQLPDRDLTSKRKQAGKHPLNALIEAKPSFANQIELYFSIGQRKALTPTTLTRLRRSPNDCSAGRYYRQVAQPFEWTFTSTQSSTAPRPN